MLRDWITLLIGAMLLVATAAIAEANTINVSWSTAEAEPDVQSYQLYSGPTDTTLVEFGDPIPFNPNAEGETTIGVPYELEVPAGEEVTVWFSVTAIDTSGNESDLATPVSVTIDAKPPAAPRGLTAVIDIVITP